MTKREASDGEAEGDLVVVKIGGSTLGSHDTALEDIVEMSRRGLHPVVVHGGGARINEWLTRHGVESRFEGGLRVTDAATLEVVVAVLAGLVNKQMVAELQALGGVAVGLSGADGQMLQCQLADEKLGLVGEITAVDPGSLARVLLAGAIPVIAPIGILLAEDKPSAQLLNINADTAAGALASALHARWLVFLTDVPGVKDENGTIVGTLDEHRARQLIGSGVIDGGMIPKVLACLDAGGETKSVIADGRKAHSLLAAVDGNAEGTVVG